MPQSEITDARKFFARLMAGAGRSADSRFEGIIESVPREDFMGAGPWKIVAGRRYVETPDDNPAYLYQNVLVGLDPARGINNGEPFLHARWIGCVEPAPGEHVTHIGAGTGYYTAILSRCVSPGGHVDAYEIDEKLAGRAAANLKPYENVSVIAQSATTDRLAPSDVIYVNAGISELPSNWLEALKPGGRLIFPWCPSPDIGLTLLVTAGKNGLDVRPLMPVWFIPCHGAGELPQTPKVTEPALARKVRSIYWAADRPPDESAVAVFDRFWFSTEQLSDE